MLATVTTLVLFAFAILTLAGMVRSEGRKMLAALQGDRWAARQPTSVRPVTVRFSQRYPASRPMRARPELRAAA